MLAPLGLIGALLGADTLGVPLLGEETDPVEPAIVVHRQPSVPLVAVRVSLLADDPAGLSGAGHLFQHLALPALEEQAARVGADVQVQRTSDALVYMVTGPAAELDYLAGALLSTLRPRVPTQSEFLAARRALAEERLAEWEIAGNHVRAALRARLFPADIPAPGNEQGADRLTRDALALAWARIYRPERVMVVAVGDVELERVRGVFAALPPAAFVAAGGRRDTVRLEPLAEAQATRGWVGAAYLATDLAPPAVAVTARMLQRALERRAPTAEVEVEHWWTHHGQAIALIAAAPPAGLEASRRALYTAVAELEASVTARGVRDAAAALRRDMLFYARTPDRMAEVVGRFADRHGEPEAAQEFYSALRRVDTDDVRSVLEQLVRLSPARVELPPQKTGSSP